MNAAPILLVEDDENDVIFFERAMRAAESTRPLHIARDGREATDYLSGIGEFADRRRFPLPGLVLLDLNLPRQHGLEVLQQIRGRDPSRGLPVIVLTSSTSDEDLRASYRLGANSYVSKPARPAELADLVRAMERYWFRFHYPSPASGY